MLPNFMVVGAQKAGTTSLHHYLREHPEIYLPAQKETKFFVYGERYEKGIDYYENEYFNDWRGEKAIGEVDPDYMYFGVALDRMTQHLDVPNMKFIFVLRDPVKRAFSHYLMTYRRGLEPLSFEQALAAEAERISRDMVSDMHYSYSARGLYSRQIKRFLEHVDQQQVLYVLSEDMRSDVDASLRRIYRFLGVDEGHESGCRKREFHEATAPRSMALLQRVQDKDGWEKKILRMLLPWKRGREVLRSSILKWNQTRVGLPVLEENVREQLIDYFNQEYKDLKVVTAMSLNQWSGLDSE